MTWCIAQFQKFNDLIKLDATRSARITDAINRFRDFSRADDELRIAADGDTFLQGSVTAGTVIKPLENDEFDVDVVYPFSLNAFEANTSPSEITNWFLSRLKQSDFYKNRLIPKDRCARINYAGDFHIDIIPATSSISEHQPYAVPAKDVRSWISNDPNGFLDWIRAKDQRGGGIDADGFGRFVRSVRMTKRWRDSFFGDETLPKSMLLTTMLGKHEPTGSYTPLLGNPLFPQYQTDIAYLYDMLRVTKSCLVLGRKSAFTHPTLNEDLARGWDDEHLDLFMQRLDTFIECIGDGIYAENDDASLAHYKEAFGETFPSS